MLQMYLDQIVAATFELVSCCETLLSMIEDTVRKINVQEDIAISSCFWNNSSPALSNNSMHTVEGLLQLQTQLLEMQEHGTRSVSALSSLLSEDCGYLRHITPNSLREAAAICDGTSSELARCQSMISITTKTLQDSCSSIDGLHDLNEAMERYLHNIKKLHELYEYTAFSCQQAAVEYELCAEGIAPSSFESHDSRSNSSDKHAYRDTVSAVHPREISDTAKAVTKNHEADTDVSSGNPELDKVHFSAVAPRIFVKGEYTLLEIIMYEDSFRNIVDEIIADSDRPAKETKSGTVRVEKYARVKVVISSPDLTIEDNTEEQYWQGEYARFSFAVELPLHYQKPQIFFIATIYINDVIATRLKFIAKCKTLQEQKLEVLREDVLSAFVSYASQDRSRVAMVIQGMKKARPDMDIFFDVESLRSGDDWEKSLWTEINKRDVLFLCWSHFAKESKWVNAEWRYAMDQKGVDYIEPIPIESPDVCPPPEELAKKHFNDMLLYVINSNNTNIP